MNKAVKLVIWVLVLELLGSVSGLLTKTSVTSWYVTLSRSPLTPPNITFGIVWSVLYAMIAIVGWMIWENKVKQQSKVKFLFCIQLLLNFSWTPIFFYYHLTGLALIILGALNIVVMLLIKALFPHNKAVALLCIPYSLWLLLAFYLNFYIWVNN